MVKKKTVSVVIVCILAVALVFGFIYDAVVTALERAEHPQKYNFAVSGSAASYGVPEALVYAVIKAESDFDPEAVSAAGAIGLMQLMPDTFEDLTNEFLREGLPTSRLYDPTTNIKYGTFYISWIHDTKFENWETVIAAYNAGIGNVQNWLKNPEYSDDGVTLKYIPVDETRAYVRKVMTAWETYERLYYTVHNI